MKLIKAYIRPEKIGEIIDSLKELNVKAISAIDVRGLGQDFLSREHKLSLELDTEISQLVKMELICENHQKKEIVRVILDEAATGEDGDGMISVTNIEEIYHISHKINRSKNKASSGEASSD